MLQWTLFESSWVLQSNRCGVMMHAFWGCAFEYLLTNTHFVSNASSVSSTSCTQLIKAYDKLLTQYNRDLGFELTLVRRRADVLTGTSTQIDQRITDGKPVRFHNQTCTGLPAPTRPPNSRDGGGPSWGGGAQERHGQFAAQHRAFFAPGRCRAAHHGRGRGAAGH